MVNKGIKIFIIILVCLVFWSGVKLVVAQEATGSVAEKYGVKYPITELGNCANIGECREFCDDPINSTTCVEYGKQKGFYDEDKLSQAKETALRNAKSSLGCDSEVSCRSFCQQPSNFTRCSNFARRYDIGGGYVESLRETQVVNKAQEVLGCNSASNCKSFCDEEANRSKCTQFARQVGLRGGEVKVGPGGCTTEQTCKTFCADPNNFRVCQGFVAALGREFRGAGGCNSEESCKTYCERNPKECGYYLQSQNSSGTNGSYAYNPIDMCSRTVGCYWSNNMCNCSNVTYSNYYQNADPAKECTKYGGCTWTGNSCNCSTPISTSGGFDSIKYKDSCIAGGCNWTNNGCDCSGTNGPAIQCGNKGCTWIDSACQCNAYSQSTGGYSGGTPYPTTAAGSYGGSFMNSELQEYYCSAGGGTCDWSSGYCYCKNYTSPYTSTYSKTGTSTGTGAGGSTSTGGNTGTYSGGSSGAYTTPYPTSSTNNTGMSRDQQQAGCTSCGGTCSWQGDFCNCQCGGSSGGNYQSPTSPPATPEPDPGTQCESSGGRWAGGQCYYDQVQGTAKFRSVWGAIWELVNEII